MPHSKRKLFRRTNKRLFAVFVHYDKNLPFLDRHRANIEMEENAATVQWDLITTSQCFSSQLERTHNLLSCSGQAARCVMVAEGRSRLLGRYGRAAPSRPAEGPESCW